MGWRRLGVDGEEVNSRQLKERAKKKKEFTAESTEDAEKRRNTESWELGTAVGGVT
jgi:hypothetical protein